MARVVIDTNVLVSAIIGRGKPRRLLRQVLGGHSAVSFGCELESSTEECSSARYGMR